MKLYLYATLNQLYSESVSTGMDFNIHVFWFRMNKNTGFVILPMLCHCLVHD